MGVPAPRITSVCLGFGGTLILTYLVYFVDYYSRMSDTQQQETAESDANHNTEINENEIAELISSIQEAQYFDASSMAPLTPRSLAALARLRAYKPPPFPVWDRLPLSRRAAVLVLLFADRRGDLRVVITIRAASLRNYSGHAAFPGGKTDTLTETPWETARREAHEEIGLPLSSSSFPKPFRIEHLCELPFSLARTALAVRPCVAFLHSDDASDHPAASVEESMIPRLDAKEVAAVFSAPFHNFLTAKDETPEEQNTKGHWYEGQWVEWHEGPWRMHAFYVPVTNQTVSKPKVRQSGQASMAEEEGEELQRYKVWGMTARMLVDAARVAYGEDPEFEHDLHIGDENMIKNLESMGKLGERVPGGQDLTELDLRRSRLPVPPEDPDSKI